MRKWNHILARMILALFLLHALMGSLMLLGFSNISFAPLSWLLFGTVIVHGVLGMISTFQTFKSGKKSGSWYLRENATFYVKRISGLLILILLIFHIQAHTVSVNGHFFLKEFTLCKDDITDTTDSCNLFAFSSQHKINVDRKRNNKF